MESHYRSTTTTNGTHRDHQDRTLSRRYRRRDSRSANRHRSYKKDYSSSRRYKPYESRRGSSVEYSSYDERSRSRSSSVLSSDRSYIPVPSAGPSTASMAVQNEASTFTSNLEELRDYYYDTEWMLQFIWGRIQHLKWEPNEFLLKEFERHLAYLGDLTLSLYAEVPEDYTRMHADLKKWHNRQAQAAERYRAFLLPKTETAVYFDGTNALAFWASYQISFYNKSYLSDEFKFLRFVEGVARCPTSNRILAGFNTANLKECVENFVANHVKPEGDRPQLEKRALELNKLGQLLEGQERLLQLQLEAILGPDQLKLFNFN